MNAKWGLGCKCELPPDWQSADFNPDFDADAVFEDQDGKLDLINKTLGFLPIYPVSSGKILSGKPLN